MFLSTSTLNGLMKKAYKTEGLTVARTLEGERDWLYLAGSYWEVSVDKDFIPNKTLGDIITLVGELPQPGGRVLATREGNQMELDILPMAVSEKGYTTDTLTITDVILIGTSGVVQRLLQDEMTGRIYPVNNVFIAIINNDMIEEDRGEYAVTEPFFNESGILWKNNACRLRARFRPDDKNTKVLAGLEGVDITPEVPVQ